MSTIPDSPTAQGRTVVHPRTGELVERLDAQPPELLADCLSAVRRQQAALKDAAGALEDELRRRLDLRGRKLETFGAYHVSVESSNEAVWDAEELEQTLRELIDDGALHAGELTGVIRREPVVSRSEINKVLGRLTGATKSRLEQCRTWKRKGPGRVHVEPSASIEPSPKLEQP